MNNSDFGFYFKRIGECFHAYSNIRAKELGLTSSQLDIALFLNSNINTVVTQREIERHFNLSHATVIGILKRMSDSGFVKVSISEEDRRQRNVALTEKANIICKSGAEKLGVLEKRIKERLSHEQEQSMRELLEVIYATVKEA